MKDCIRGAAIVLAFAALACAALWNTPPDPEEVAHDRAVKICDGARAAHRLIYPIGRCVAAEMEYAEDDDGGPYDNDDGDGDAKK